MKYRPEFIEPVLRHLRTGMTQEDAYILAGISRDTFYTWMREKPEFAEAVVKAQLECKQRNVVRVQNASRRDWRAAAWWLKNKHSEEYHDKTNVGLGGTKGAPPVQVVATNANVDMGKVKHLTKDQLQALATLEHLKRDEDAGDRDEADTKKP